MIERVRQSLSGRARWFDIIEVTGMTTPVSFKNNRLHSITERQNSGYGVRVNVSGKTGFSYTNDSSMVEEAAAKAAVMSPYGDLEEFEIPAQAKSASEPHDDSINAFDIALEISKAEAAIGSILASFPTANMDCKIVKSLGNTRIMNSNGLDVSYRSSRYSASLSATLIPCGDAKIDVWEGASALAPIDFENLAQKIALKLENARQVKKIPSGKVPVIASPKAFARIIGIMTAGLNAKSVYKGISPFGDKIGASLFAPALTISDDPEDPGSPFSYPFDDEGVTATKKILVKSGRIEKFIADLKHARKLNITPEGNGLRGYSSLPYPSFSNVIIDNGKEPSTAILKSIKLGVLVDQFIGFGQSNTLTGDFSAGLDLAYLVENGEITGRVKDCMLSDNIFSILAGDIILSSDREWTGAVLAPFALLPSVNYTG
jgi:PmbA protein